MSRCRCTAIGNRLHGPHGTLPIGFCSFRAECLDPRGTRENLANPLTCRGCPRYVFRGLWLLGALGWTGMTMSYLLRRPRRRLRCPSSGSGQRRRWLGLRLLQSRFLGTSDTKLRRHGNRSRPISKTYWAQQKKHLDALMQADAKAAPTESASATGQHTDIKTADKSCSACKQMRLTD